MLILEGAAAEAHAHRPGAARHSQLPEVGCGSPAFSPPVRPALSDLINLTDASPASKIGRHSALLIWHGRGGRIGQLPPPPCRSFLWSRARLACCMPDPCRHLAGGR